MLLYRKINAFEIFYVILDFKSFLIYYFINECSLLAILYIYTYIYETKKASQ